MLKFRLSTTIAAVLAIVFGSVGLGAQGVTTSSLAGTVTAPTGAGLAGARITAVHVPSGTTYQGVSRQDGRYIIPNMRVGGPYAVSAQALGFEKQTQSNITLQLGQVAEVSFKMATAVVKLEAVAVTAQTGVLSEGRTGAATTVQREALTALPTINRSINDFTRLTPQASGTSFAGMDNRLNNITVDGSFFNNSFGLAGQPGGRTGSTPIPLDAVDQIQVNVAPFDVRQGNFVGAGVNTVTKSGTNRFEGSIYGLDRTANTIGRTANGARFDPGVFDYRNFGVRLGGPIIKDKLFFFVNYENEKEEVPGTPFLPNAGGQPVGGNITRVLETDVRGLSDFLRTNFQYETGPWTGFNNATPQERIITKLDWNATARNKFSLRYLELMSSADILVSNSASLGFGNRRTNLNSLSYENSGYGQGEYIRSLVGEWNAQIGSNMSNNMILGYTSNDESRVPMGQFFPMIDILNNGTTYLNAGFEPFTPANQLRYKTLQFQNNFQIFTSKHDLTFGVAAQRYRSENVFFPGSQSAYSYNSLDDFYRDARDFLANPNRTTSPVTLRRFQVRFNNIPGQVEPIQPLEVTYAGAYAQDEWRAAKNLKLTIGLRVDVPVFENTALRNPEVEGFSFRDETGATVRYRTDKMPDAAPLWSPRFGFNWDARGDRSTQVRGGLGVFTGSPPFVWISNQVGNNGILTGFEELNNVTTRPFNPNPDRYKPTTVTGAPAASYELALTEPTYKFPQLLRGNLAVDQKLPYGFVATFEFLYGRDVNGAYYINANLPAAQSRFTGPDQRLRWTSNRINSKIANAMVIKNQDIGRSYHYAFSLERAFEGGLFIKGAYSYGLARNTIDPGSIAAGSWNGNQQFNDPNNPGLSLSGASAGHRAFGVFSYKKDFFGWGPTMISLFVETRNLGQASYVFAGDMNGDGAVNNELIYVPRNQAEMNFQQFTTGGRTFTVADQRAAFDAYINQDPYLRTRRGQYAERNAFFLPMITRADLAFSQDIGRRFFRKDQSLQLRLDVINFTNMINSSWGVGKQIINNQILSAQGVDASGAPLYRMATSGGDLIRTTFRNTAGLGDVYRMQMGVRYSFY